MKTICKWMLIATAFSPLVVFNSVFFPYISGKSFVIRGLIFLTTFGYLFLVSFKKDVRDEMSKKLKALWKHPIGKALAVSLGLLIISTIFAYDQSMAMFGNIERGEGFVGVSIFYLFFALCVLIFEKKDWLYFFGVYIFTGWILFLHELTQFFGGNTRPGSFTDNAIYLAAYFLFTIFASFVLWKHGKQIKNNTLAYFGIISAIISLIGILITQTRGVELGMFVGGFVALLYLVFKGKNIKIFKKVSLQKFAKIACIVAVAFVLIFAGTKQLPIWQHMPGFSRLANFTFKDGSTQSRLMNTTMSIKAVDPANGSIKNTLVGWGWDNFLYAWQKFYNPHIFLNDPATFDRAHNKLMDMLVMTGVLGLLSYLAIWFFFFKSIFKIGKNSLIECAMGLFFATAYFLENLTVFDAVVTYLVFFTMLAYIVSQTMPEVSAPKNIVGKNSSIIFFVILAVFSGWTFFVWTWVPNNQMSDYVFFLTHGPTEGSPALTKDSSIFEPDDYAQGTLRQDFIEMVRRQSPDVVKQYLPVAIYEMEKYTADHPYNFKYILDLAGGYDSLAQITGNTEFLKTAEKYYKQSMILIPGRQDVVYAYSNNLMLQKRNDEAIQVLKDNSVLSPEVWQTYVRIGDEIKFQGDTKNDEALSYYEMAFDHYYAFFVGADPKKDPNFSGTVAPTYQKLLMYYYGKNDIAKVRLVAKRLAEMDATNGQAYQNILNFIDKNNTLPKVDFPKDKTQ